MSEIKNAASNHDDAVGLLQEEDVIAKAWLDALDLGIRGPPVV